ncbi:MAG: hypothetical protein ACN4GT_13385 [Gammaproteobacteria bacterium]
MVRRFGNGALACAALLLPSIALSQDGATAAGSHYRNLDRKLSVGIGGAYERFDTNFVFIDKSTGLRAQVDAEGTLGLPEFELAGAVYGYWKPGKRHGLGFSFWRVNRTANLLTIDENFGDLNVSGNVSLSDQTRFYYLTYNFTAMQDERAMVLLSFGAYGLDLKYVLEANGSINFRGIPLLSDSYREEARQFAPLPMLGVDAWFAMTPNWALGSKVAIVAGSYKDISGGIFEARIRAKYAFNRNVGLLFGFNFFQGRIDIDDDDLKTEIAYGFNGIFAGLDVGF